MTKEPVPSRAELARSPHDLVSVEVAPRAWTVAKIGGLVALTALGAALAAAILAGGALFTILNIG